MKTNREVVELVKKLTEEQNMSMSELARRVGIAKSAISRYFNGTRELPLNK
ncbi:helix-turn-helix transcriptional regulator, partial [uncultured Gemella sp.]|uniref:helix-turn-helix domain-containing protein n=1 Tax=uncultured Gemella sp. TaxID=254352 RepID=UPI00262F0933